jgi:hypothetical protein
MRRPTTPWVGAIAWIVACAMGGVGACAKAPEACTSGEDEDGDLLVDCVDPDCWVAGGDCPETCSGWHDEDDDARVDCDDPDCWVAGSGCAETCGNGSDEDGDGETDCADADCWILDGGCDEICAGGNDEDGDGRVDCEDSDCWVPEAGCAERCEGGDDEDADRTVDCADEDCRLDPVCVPSYETDVRPIFYEHCLGPQASCHSDRVRVGGMSIESYDDMPLPSIYCAGETKGWCSLFRILEPTMPANCLDCLPAAQIDVIQRWVDGGIPP